MKDRLALPERYQIMKLIGRGLASEVYQVKDKSLHKIVALKIGGPEQSPESELQFQREFYFLSRFNHPHIVPVYDFGTTADGRPFFTMEYINGHPITHHFSGFTPKIFPVIAQICQALQAIHNQGLVHCDLKPENILIRKPKGQAVILDFGFAEEIRQAGISSSGGTPGYAAPEVFKGTGIDARTDLYSLGLVLYETLSQRKPFGEKSPVSQLKAQYYSELPRLVSLDPKIPEELDTLIQSLVQKEPQARPTSAYEILESLPAISTVPIQLPASESPKNFILTSGFIGRESMVEELKNLSRKIIPEPTVTVKEGSVVLITGEQGVGKSRLLKELKFLVQLDRTPVIFYDPLAQGEKTNPFLQHLVSQILDPEERIISSTLENKKYELFERLIAGLQQRAPLVVLLDDLHLIDPLSAEFFRYLAISVAKIAILLVATSLAEPGSLDLIQSLGLKPHVHLLTLPPLTPEETNRLAVSFLGTIEKSDHLSSWLYERTGGNPLFIYETIHALVDQLILKRKPGRWIVDLERLAGYKPAPRLEEQISARLSHLSPEEIRVLSWACAIGRSFEPRFLPATTGSRFATIESLVAKGFLNSIFRTGRIEYVFANKTIKELIDVRLQGEKRKKLFFQVAQTLEALGSKEPPGSEDELLFELANTYCEAGIPDKTYQYSLKAAQRAYRSSLLLEALSHYQVALRFAGPLATPEEHSGILETIGDIENLSARFPAALESYRNLVLLLQHDNRFAAQKPLLSRVVWKLGTAYQMQGKTEEAIAQFKTAQTLLPSEPAPEAVQITSSLGWAYNALGDYPKAEKTFNQALETARELNNPAAAIEVLHGLCATAWYQKDFAKAVALGEESKQIAERTNAPYQLAGVNNSLGTIYGEQGELQKAQTCYEQAFAFLKKIVSPYYLLRTLQGLGLIHNEQSQWTHAREYFEEALAWAEKIGDQRETAGSKNNLGLALVELGEWHRALEQYQESRSIAKKLGDENFSVAVLDNISSLFMLMGDLPQAEKYLAEALKISGQSFALVCGQARLQLLKQDYRSAEQSAAQALKLARQADNSPWLRKAYLLVSEVQLARSDFLPALSNARQALAITPDPSKEYALGLRLAGVARSSSGDKEGLKQIQDSIDRFRSLGARYELARSLFEAARLTAVDSGSSIAAIDDFAPIVHSVEEAHTIFQHLGAIPDCEHARKLKDEIVRRVIEMKPRRLARREYLRIFSELSELINLGMAKEDFLDRILDLVIGITNAERGLLFFLEDGDLRLVAGRQMDHVTVEDAKNISRSIIRKVEEAQEPVFCADALSDPRFDATQSVKLNRIHSILCAPLQTPTGVIGTIYLDSRITNNLFLEEEKDFLLAVSNLLAATIDKSVAFKKLQDEVSHLRDGIIVDAATGYFLGKSDAVRQIYAEVEKIAPTDCTVLILGATGSGKGILARLVHNRSSRRDSKFVSVNCGTLPETLFESELFGHRKGAFTGATRDRQGILEAAAGGTVFLDEITNTSAAIQAKLLELLDDKTIRRLGDDESCRVDVRLICATNRDLQEEITAGRFREDLFYRLSGVTMKVPPLKERLEDIPLLAQYFIERYASQLNKRITGFTPEVRAVFLKYPWPGNVRELQNTLERAVIMAEGKKIGLADLKLHIAPDESQPVVLRDDVKIFERKLITDALQKSQGNISRAAKLLSIHRRQLQRLIRAYQIK
jgi:Nif-specific regulatory protein